MTEQGWTDPSNFSVEPVSVKVILKVFGGNHMAGQEQTMHICIVQMKIISILMCSINKCDSIDRDYRGSLHVGE